MADNTTLNTGTGGDVIATDDVTTLNGAASSAVKVQRVKVGFGDDATYRDTSTAFPLPIRIGDGTNVITLDQNNNDGAAATEWTMPTESYGMVFNGTTWDRARGDTTSGLWVNIKNTSVAVSQGTAAASSGAWPAKVTDGTNVAAVKAASTAAASTDPALVVQLNPLQPALATPLNIQGGKTNNAAAPGATNEGALVALANAAVPSWTEGNQVLVSADLAGALRATLRPPVVLGAYRFAGQTGVYAGLAAGAILFSFRWTDATKICLVTRVRVAVNTTTAASVAGMIDRDLVIVRSFTVADSAGTAVTLSGNNQKMRASQATTVVGGIQIANTAALTAGTGTADAQAIGLVTRQGTATEPVGLTVAPEDLFTYTVDQNYPITLAANEGLRVRIPTAMPASLAQRTTVTIEWMEVASSGVF